MISIVIRAKNEALWLARCLSAVSLQDCADVELLLVDNDSADDTREIGKRFGCRILNIPERDFRYGGALNLGLRHARGSLVAILSAHCIPVHDQWLATLVAPFDDPRVAGVYGRQIPLPDSDPFDKRDLWTTFGIERRVQRSDYFFHNANAMLRRDLWKRFPFDDSIAGVEDRDWAKRVISAGCQLAYEPLASVYHHHGIHQGRDMKRAERVVRVIEMIDGVGSSRGRTGQARARLVAAVRANPH